MNTISWEFCGWHQTNVQICSYIRRHYRNLNTTPEICDVIQGIREPQHIPAQKTTEYVKKIPEYVKRPNILNKIPGSEVSTSGSCTLMTQQTRMNPFLGGKGASENGTRGELSMNNRAVRTHTQREREREREAEKRRHSHLPHTTFTHLPRCKSATTQTTSDEERTTSDEPRTLSHRNRQNDGDNGDH